MRSLALASAMVGSLLGASGAIAQSEPLYPTGLEPSSLEDVESAPVVSLTRAYIPEAISLVDRFPEPGSQGKTGTCVVWATAYAARSYYNALLSGSQSRPGPGQIASPAYLHNLMYWSGSGQSKACEHTGWGIAKALDTLRVHGTVSHQDYDFSNVCRPQVVANASLAAHNRIASRELIAWAPQPGSPAYGLGKTYPVNLDKVRQQLALGHPVIIGMLIGSTFQQLAPGTIYNDTIAETRGTKLGGHAMVVVGYDDRRQAFYVMNSWGRGWAEGGFGWISYRSFLADVEDAWKMTVAGVTPPIPPPTRPPAPEPYGILPPHVAKLHCADVHMGVVGVSRDGREVLGLGGFVATSDDMRKIDALAREKGLASTVLLRPWPVCEAMLTLKDPLRAPSRPRVSINGGRVLASGVTSLAVRQAFSIEIAAPDVPAFMYAYYIEDDGTVVNLIPRRGPMRKQTMPGERLVIGDGRGGQPTFRIAPLASSRPLGDPMRGHEAVVVIAARAPIDEFEEREGPDGPFFRVAERSANHEGPPDRLLLSLLRDITLRRAEAHMLPREVSAAVVHLKIED